MSIHYKGKKLRLKKHIRQKLFKFTAIASAAALLVTNTNLIGITFTHADEYSMVTAFSGIDDSVLHQTFFVGEEGTIVLPESITATVDHVEGRYKDIGSLLGKESASPSASVSPSASASPSVSKSPDISPSAEPSASPSETPTESGAPSATPTESPNAAENVSPSASESQSATGSPSASPSGTPSETPAASMVPSVTPKISATPGVSPTITPTANVTATSTATMTPSPAESAADDENDTPSESPSTTPAETPEEDDDNPTETPSPVENPSASPESGDDDDSSADNNVDGEKPSEHEENNSDSNDGNSDDSNDGEDAPEYAKAVGIADYLENVRSMFAPIVVYAAEGDEHEYKDIDLGNSDAEENNADVHDADPDKKQKRVISTADEIISLSWTIDPSRSSGTQFTTEAVGEYIFVAKIDSEYVLDDGIVLPEIEVRVVEAEESAMDYVTEIDGIKISVKAPEGVFPAGSRVEVKRVENQSRLKVIEYVVEEKLENEVEEILLFDINVFDKKGNKIQPDNTKGEVKVAFENVPMDIEDSSENEGSLEDGDFDREAGRNSERGSRAGEESGETPEIRMFRVDEENGDVTLLDTEVSGNTVEAVAEHFSEYGAAKPKAATPTASMSFFELGSADDLVNCVLGSGVTATNCSKTGTVYAFSGGSDIGIESGIVLDTSGKYSSSECAELNKLIAAEGQKCGGHTSTLQFDMKATGTVLRFNYIFASAEFNQPAQFNDIFGLFVKINDGPFENVALINGGKNVTIQNLKSAGSSHYSSTAKTLGLINSTETSNGISVKFEVEKPVPLGADVTILFAIADVTDYACNSWVMIEAGSLSFDAPESKPDYSTERLSNLKPGKTYEITSIKYDSDGNVKSEATYIFVADENGSIKLEGTDKNGKAYNFIGTTLKIIQKGEGDVGDSDPQILTIGARPDTPTDPNAPPMKPTEVDYDDVETTVNSMKVKGLYYQEYTIDYNPDNKTATWIKPDAYGYVYFNDLDKDTIYRIRTRVAAVTDQSPASEASNGIEVQPKGMFVVTKHNYDGVYDGQEHYAEVTCDVPGAEISYCEVEVYDSSEDISKFTESKVNFKNVGEHHVYYMIKGDGYYTAYGSVIVNITKRKLVIKADNKTIGRDDEEPKLSYTITNGSVAPGDSLEGISLSRIPGRNGGDYTISVDVDPTKNTNYQIECVPGKLHINTAINETIVPKDGAPETSWGGMADEDALAIIGDRDKEKVDSRDLTVFLEVSSLNPDDAALASDVAKTEELIEAKDADYQNGMYLDLSMFKQFDGESAEKITNAVTPNEITIKISIPDELIAPANVIREYSVVRIHGGEADELPCIYDNESQTISFSTNRFSTYSIWYKDTLIANPEEPQPKIDVKKPKAQIEEAVEPVDDYVEVYYDEPNIENPVVDNPVAAEIKKPEEKVLSPLPPIEPKINKATKSPQTGDASNMLLWILELMVIIGTLAGIKVYAEKNKLF